MAKPTMQQIARTEAEYSRIAGSPIRVEFPEADDTPITEGGSYGNVYAFGSELGVLRLWAKMMHGRARYSENLGEWYWTPGIDAPTECTTVDQILSKGRAIWGNNPQTFLDIIACMGMIYGDICREARKITEGEPPNKAQVAKEFGNMIVSTIRWADDMGIVVNDCIAAALTCQAEYARNADQPHAKRLAAQVDPEASRERRKKALDWALKAVQEAKKQVRETGYMPSIDAMECISATLIEMRNTCG